MKPALTRIPEAVKGRQCGDCSLCCRVMGIDALDKPAGRWCAHCAPGKGCTIYANRPDECQTFSCAWLSGHLPEDLKPNKVGAVIVATAGQDTVLVHVDSNRPDTPDKAPLREFIDFVSASFPVVIITGNKRRLIARKPDIAAAVAEKMKELRP